LTVTAVSAPVNGTVTLVSGQITFTPAADYNGPASFSYTVTDNGTTNGADDFKSDTGTVNVTVTEVNDTPDAVNDSKTTAEDTATTFDPRTNDSTGPPNESTQTLAVTAVTQGAHGTVSFTAGSVTYTPAADYNGPDSFTYTITDNGTTNGVNDFKSDTATVNVTVTEVNDKPTAATDTKTTAEDTALTFPASDLTANDSTGPANESGQTLTVTAVGSPVNGTVSLASGQITFTPAADYNGPASFSYTVTDNGTTAGSPDAKFDSATVNVTVTEVNDAPDAVNDSKSTPEDMGLTFDPRSNDNTGPANESGQSLTITAVTQGAHGSVTFTGGTVTYTPAADYNGPDSFTYTITDNGTTNGNPDPKTDTATVYMTVTEVNDKPTAVADSKSTAEDTALVFAASTLTTNDSKGPANESGQTLTVTAVTATADTHGAVVLASGNVTYTPAADYNGPASFSYTVTDNGTTGGSADPKSDTGTVNVTVTEVNDTPDAMNDSKSTTEDAGLTFDPRSNDNTGPANESGQLLSVTSVTQGAHGTVTFAAGSVTYTPAADYNGPDTFTYTITDNGTTNGNPDPKTDTATVYMTVTEVNDKPTAVADSKMTPEDTAVTFDPRTNDSKGPANESTQTLSVTGVTQGTYGTVTFTATSVTYTPTANFNGSDTFTYTVTDNGTTAGLADPKSDTATESITVTAQNDGPTATNDTATQATQFSDAIADVKVTAKDIDSTTLTQTPSAITYKFNGGASQSGLPSGLSIAPTSSTPGTPSATPGIYNPPTTSVWTISGRMMVQAGTYDITVPVSDGSASGSTTFTIVVAKEDASLEYSGDVFKNATSSTSVNVAAVIREAGVVGGPSESPALIGNQLAGRQIKFTVYTFNGGAVSGGTCTATITSTGTGTGSATCPVTLAVSDDPYRVHYELLDNGYYTALADDQTIVVQTVGAGFVTGGGWLNEPNLGSKSNFGFTVKRLKNGNLQGNSNYIYRKTVLANQIAYGTGYLPAGPYNWQIKSNSWAGGGLTSACTTTAPIKCTATFSGKANIKAINRVTGVEYSLGGNYQYQIDVDDFAEPGSSPGAGPDGYAIRVWDPTTGTYYRLGSPRSWNPTFLWDPTDSGYGTRLPINGGNIQVHT